MTYLNEAQLADLQEMAASTGKCERCQRKLAIYRYRVNKQVATVLKKMADRVKATNQNVVNFNDVDLPYRLTSQRTKLRQHGLIAKYKDDAGHHVANTWLITKKGGDFLRGVAIPEKVVVFDNQVIGHDGKMVTIDRLIEDLEINAAPITEEEATAMRGLREEPRRNFETKAEFVGKYDSRFEAGQTYQITIGRLQLGRPVAIQTEKGEVEYPDIAAFQRAWRVLK